MIPAPLSCSKASSGFSIIQRCLRAVIPCLAVIAASTAGVQAQTAQRIYELNGSFAETNGGSRRWFLQVGRLDRQVILLRLAKGQT
jgi:hypothetical protein